MNYQTKYLTKEMIETAADSLLYAFSHSVQPVTLPPVPVDDILELHLGLSLDFDNLAEHFGFDDVHGAIYMETKEVFVDESLDPRSFPNMTGRYRFTVAHEIGHWSLHRHLARTDRSQQGLFGEEPARPTVVCRRSEADKIRVEYQANHFAACLLMPRPLVREAWKRVYPTHNKLDLETLEPRRADILSKEILSRGSLNCSESGIIDAMLEHAARPLADRFEVSTSAMRIRLEGLELLSRSKSKNLELQGVS